MGRLFQRMMTYPAAAGILAACQYCFLHKTWRAVGAMWAHYSFDSCQINGFRASEVLDDMTLSTAPQLGIIDVPADSMRSCRESPVYLKFSRVSTCTHDSDRQLPTDPGNSNRPFNNLTVHDVLHVMSSIQLAQHHPDQDAASYPTSLGYTSSDMRIKRALVADKMAPIPRRASAMSRTADTIHFPSYIGNSLKD